MENTSPAQLYALVFGAVLVVTEDNVLHLVIRIAGLAAGAAPAPAPARERPA